jgi:hypothetical protein
VETIRGTAERAVNQTKDTVKQTVQQAARATGTEGNIPGTSNI